jgi:hypothetical protein
MGTWFFLGVKRPGSGVDHTPTSRAEIKESVELYFYFSSILPVLFWGKKLPYIRDPPKNVYTL